MRKHGLSYWMVDGLGRKCYKVPRRIPRFWGLLVFAAIALLCIGYILGYAVGRAQHDTWTLPDEGAKVVAEYPVEGDKPWQR